MNVLGRRFNAQGSTHITAAAARDMTRGGGHHSAAQDIPWSRIQSEAIAYVNEVMEGRVPQVKAHELPPRPPDKGSGRWLRDSFPTVKQKTEEKKEDVGNGSPGKKIQPNTLVSQRLAKASTVHQLALVATAQVFPPCPPHRIDQQEYESRVALDTLSVLIGARKVEFEPNGGRKSTLRTRVRDPDPSYDLQKARSIFHGLSQIQTPYLNQGLYSLSYLTVIFQCVNILQLDPDDFSWAALAQAAKLISRASEQLTTSVQPGTCCAFLQSISHPVSRRIYSESTTETQSEIKISSDSFSQRMSIRQLSVAYSCLVKLDAISWDSSLVVLLTSRLRTSDWAQDVDSLVQALVSFVSHLRSSKCPHSITTQMAKLLLLRVESLSIKGCLSLDQMISSLASSVVIFRRLDIKSSSKFISAVVTASSVKGNASTLTCSMIVDLLWSMASLKWIPTSNWLLGTLDTITTKRSKEGRAHGTIKEMAKLAWALSELSRLSPSIKATSSTVQPRTRNKIRAIRLAKANPVLAAPVRQNFKRREGVVLRWMRAFCQDCSSLMAIELKESSSKGDLVTSAFSWAPVLARTTSKLSSSLSIRPSSTLKQNLSASLTCWAASSSSHDPNDIFSAVYGAVHLHMDEPQLLSALTIKSLTLLNDDPRKLTDFLCLISKSPRWKLNHQESTLRWFNAFFALDPLPSTPGQRLTVLSAIAKGLPEGQTIPSSWVEAYWQSTEPSLLGLSQLQMMQMSTGILLLYRRSLLSRLPHTEWSSSFIDRFGMLEGLGSLSLWERTLISQAVNTIKSGNRKKL